MGAPPECLQGVPRATPVSLQARPLQATGSPELTWVPIPPSSPHLNGRISGTYATSLGAPPDRYRTAPGMQKAGCQDTAAHASPIPMLPSFASVQPRHLPRRRPAAGQDSAFPILHSALAGAALIVHPGCGWRGGAFAQWRGVVRARGPCRRLARGRRSCRWRRRARCKPSRRRCREPAR